MALTVSGSESEKRKFNAGMDIDIDGMKDFDTLARDAEMDDWKQN